MGRRMIRRSCLLGRCHAPVAKGSRSRSSRDRRLAVVHRSALLGVIAGRLRVLSLSGYRRNVVLICRRLLFRTRPRSCSAVAAVVTDAVNRYIVCNFCRINVVDVGDIYVVDRTVVKKSPIFPTAAFITHPEESEAVVDPAIETNTRTPVAFMENEPGAFQPQ